VRTSIKQLEKEGLLEAMSRGVIVSVLTPADAAEI
jgi:DNA-binding GntR family transcriptional regulator